MNIDQVLLIAAMVTLLTFGPIFYGFSLYGSRERSFVSRMVLMLLRTLGILFIFVGTAVVFANTFDKPSFIWMLVLPVAAVAAAVWIIDQRIPAPHTSRAQRRIAIAAASSAVLTAFLYPLSKWI